VKVAPASAFWDDLAANLSDANFARAFVLESIRTKNLDAIVNELNKAVDSSPLTHLDLAEAISVKPQAVRRILNATSPTVTFEVLSNVAAALGYKLTLEPLSEPEQNAVDDAVIAAPAPHRCRRVPDLQ
jgi:hypothetical protein